MPLKTLSLEHGANIAVFPNTLTYLEMYADSNCDMEALPETLKYLYLRRTSFSRGNFSTLPRNLETLYLRDVTTDNEIIGNTGYISFMERLINDLPRYLKVLHIYNIVINGRILTFPYEVIPYLPPYLNDLSIRGFQEGISDPYLKSLFSVEVTRRNMRSQSDLLMEFPKTLEKLFITPKPEIPLRFYPNLISFNGNTLPLRC